MGEDKNSYKVLFVIPHDQIDSPSSYHFTVKLLLMTHPCVHLQLS